MPWPAVYPTHVERIQLRMIRHLLSALCLGACACLSSSSVPQSSAASSPIMLAVVNAKVWTGDRSAPWAEAIAVSGGELALVGSSAEVRRLAAGVTPIDAA